MLNETGNGNRNHVASAIGKSLLRHQGSVRDVHEILQPINVVSGTYSLKTGKNSLEAFKFIQMKLWLINLNN